LFFLFSLCLNSCANPQIQNHFYLGLSNAEEAVSLFERALTSSNVHIRQAAAEQLADLMASGTQLSARTERRLRREVSGWWAAAFNIIRNPDREKLLEFLLNYGHGVISGDNFAYLLQECEKKGVLLTEYELAAINGHFAISRLHYHAALESFRNFMDDGIWPENIPELFLEYPVLINDLGRALQFTSTGMEGNTLFLQWENNLVNSMAEAPDDVRYRLLFFAARIARRNGNASAVSLFEQALSFAPDTEQLEACIWYILDLSFSDRPVFIEQLEKLTPYWQRGSYFNNILERFLQTLAANGEWKNVIHVFNLIQDSNAAIRAGYAWIIARTVEEGFLTTEEMAFAAEAVNTENAEASVFMEIAYNATDNIVGSVLYYRAITSQILGLPFMELPESNHAVGNNRNSSPALQFLLGFFTHDAGDHVLRYIRQLEQEMSPDELRIVAQSLEQAGMYVQSIRLVSRYIIREGYTINRCDMKLLFPRGYRELVEKYAEEFNIAPEILFALIRTESAFQSSVVSHAGAVGLTQLMPPTADEMAGRLRRASGPDYASDNGLDLTNPELNVHIGTFYLDYLMDRFDDMLLSLLAYNGGMNRVRRWRVASSLPVDLFLETVIFFETRDYGRKVLGDAAVYKALYY
jgi:soluble lytic murein transglycosylase